MDLLSAVRVESYICGLGTKKEKRAKIVKKNLKMLIRWIGAFVCMLVLFTGCSELGIGTIQETSPAKYGEWEKYHTVPSFLPQKIDDYTVNAYSYTLYNYMDTCYEIFLDITVSEEQFNELIENARQCSDVLIERETYYSEGYTEIVIADMYEKGDINEHDGLEQVGIAEIDKVVYNPETFHILYVSFHAEDTSVYDVERIAYFNRFSIAPDEYIEHLYEVTADE